MACSWNMQSVEEGFKHIWSMMDVVDASLAAEASCQWPLDSPPPRGVEQSPGGSRSRPRHDSAASGHVVHDTVRIV